MSPPHDTSKGRRLERQFIADWLRRVTWLKLKFGRVVEFGSLSNVQQSATGARNCAGQHHRVAIGENFLPAGHGLQGQDQGRIGGEHYGLDPPLI